MKVSFLLKEIKTQFLRFLEAVAAYKTGSYYYPEGLIFPMCSTFMYNQQNI